MYIEDAIKSALPFIIFQTILRYVTVKVVYNIKSLSH